MTDTHLLKVNTGDKVIMRKPHPCGSTEWMVVRTGADVGLKCLKCGRRVLLPREEFEKKVKAWSADT